MQAHSNVRIEDLFGSGPISKQLALEVEVEVRTHIRNHTYHTTTWIGHASIHTLTTATPRALQTNKQVRRAKAALKEFLPVFPDLLNSVKTEIAARFLLHKHRSLLEDACETGSINSRCGLGLPSVCACMQHMFGFSSPAPTNRTKPGPQRV